VAEEDREAAEPKPDGPYQYKDFRFRLEEPAAQQQEDISSLLSPLRSRIREGNR
jgi:hypothetical protein